MISCPHDVRISLRTPSSPRSSSVLAADRQSGPPREDLPLPTEPPFMAFVGNLPFDITEGDLQEFFGDTVRIVLCPLLWIWTSSFFRPRPSKSSRTETSGPRVSDTSNLPTSMVLKLRSRRPAPYVTLLFLASSPPISAATELQWTYYSGQRSGTSYVNAAIPSLSDLTVPQRKNALVSAVVHMRMTPNLPTPGDGMALFQTFPNRAMALDGGLRVVLGSQHLRPYRRRRPTGVPRALPLVHRRLKRNLDAVVPDSEMGHQQVLLTRKKTGTWAASLSQAPHPKGNDDSTAQDPLGASLLANRRPMRVNGVGQMLRPETAPHVRPLWLHL